MLVAPGALAGQSSVIFEGIFPERLKRTPNQCQCRVFFSLPLLFLYHFTLQFDSVAEILVGRGGGDFDLKEG